MNRATVGIAIVTLAAALTLAGTPHTLQAPAAYTGDPSVPHASDVFRAADARNGAQGNVEDLAY